MLTEHLLRAYVRLMASPQKSNLCLRNKRNSLYVALEEIKEEKTKLATCVAKKKVLRLRGTFVHKLKYPHSAHPSNERFKKSVV